MIESSEESFVSEPRKLIHTFRRTTSGPVKFPVTISLSGFKEFFFEVMRDEEIAVDETTERALEVAAKYNLAFVGPPLG